MTEPVPCVIRTLAPVHLGADEVYEPLGFVIDEQNSCLVAFEPGDFLDLLPEADRRRLLEICRKGTVASLLELYRFYYERRRLARGRAVPVCPGLVQHYREFMDTRAGGRDLQRTLNRFTIQRTAFLARDQRPYIPGTAIKGALRTAYLNALATIKPLPTPKDHKGNWDPRRLENLLLDYRGIDEDPFRLLKVSDFLPVGEVKTRIVYAVNEKKKASRFAARGPYQILEVIEPGAAFLGTVTVAELPPEIRASEKNKIRHFLAAADLWTACRLFYRQEKAAEDNTLFELGLRGPDVPEPPGEVLLRLGRHSGADCVTIAGHRHIKIMRARGENPQDLPHATTLWLAADFHHRERRREANLRPFGWVILKELGAAQAAALRDQEAAWRQKLEASRRAPAQVGASPQKTMEDEKAQTKREPTQPQLQVWERAILTWEANKGELTAHFQGKKAFTRNRELLPAELHPKLLAPKKKKAVTARVTVEPEGLAFRLVKIECP